MSQRLDSWKEIAAYLRRDVTTVRRWEKREELPVRRHRHGKLGSVYAFTDEIDAWYEQRSRRGGNESAGGRSQGQPVARVDTAGVAEAQASLAVLPFANLSAGADGDYFSDGLADEIINALGQLSGLRVIARTSSFAFKGKHDDIRKIASVLGVTHVLEGSVRRSGTKLRVTAQLIRANDGSQVWSERYDRELVDLFAMQDDIAMAIARALKVTLTSSIQRARPQAPKIEAHEAYLKARYQLPSSLLIDAPETSARAERYFQDAMALDERWADPHTALAYLYLYLGRLGIRQLPLMMAKARVEAMKALELQASEATAHAVLGAIAGSYEYDWAKAGEHFQIATAAKPVEPAVHDLFVLSYLEPLGRFDSAVQQVEQAIVRDPLNLLWRERRLNVIASSGMYQEAIAEARTVLEFDEKSFLSHFVIASSYLAMGDLQSAHAAAEEAYRLAPWHVSAGGLLAGVLEKVGDYARAASIVASLTRTKSMVGLLNYHLARLDVDGAIDAFLHAIEERQPIVSQLVRSDFVKPLHSSARWAQIMKMMNLSDVAEMGRR